MIRASDRKMSFDKSSRFQIVCWSIKDSMLVDRGDNEL